MLPSLVKLRVDRRDPTILLAGLLPRRTLLGAVEILCRHRSSRPVYVIHGDCDGPMGEQLSPLQLVSVQL